ncbi:unnamed protein product [Periconia digitata]|uniref:NAD(P)-binding protein n=1 Tax=Periconia digitata TaxID=1303443 RepID=A0A9W4XMQ5_9PLEO|nr:unnamed protein product [Periconia digitata]
MSTKETIFVIGATGNIGTSAVHAALSAGYNVLATVRNTDSAEKLFKNLGGRKEGITTVEVDCVSETGIKSVIEKIQDGKVPGFQHVYACVGGPYSPLPLTEVTTQSLRDHMTINFEGNFFAYRATIPYLIAQAHPTSTWTMCTGSQGEIGEFAAPAMSQGALFSLANCATQELKNTNVRFNEVYLGLRVETDESAALHGVVKASEFAEVYVAVLKAGGGMKGQRVLVEKVEDMKNVRWVAKIKE